MRNIELQLLNLQKKKRNNMPRNNMPIEIDKIIYYQPGYQSSDREKENVPRPVPILPTPNVSIPGQSGPIIRPPVPNQYHVPVTYAPRPVLRPSLIQSQPRMNSYTPRRGAPVRKNVPLASNSSLIPSRKNSRAYKGSSKCNI